MYHSEPRRSRGEAYDALITLNEKTRGEFLRQPTSIERTSAMSSERRRLPDPSEKFYLLGTLFYVVHLVIELLEFLQVFRR